MEIDPDTISLDSYNKMAEYYARFVDTKPWNAYYERPAMIDLLPDVSGKKVLDAGCAGGWYSQWLLDHGACPFAVDVNKNMVAVTQKRTQNKCFAAQADLNVPLEIIQDDSMDIIITSLVLHYIKNLSFVFCELYKKLKPDGILIFSTNHPFTDFLYRNQKNYFELALINDEWTMDKERIPVQYYSRPLGDILQPAINAGFCIKKIVEPVPTEEFRNVLPEEYKHLLTWPNFLCVKAKKL
ncbi:SAM-dependent methyltransferase [Spirochaetia bacterium]|nr:SAM-dependent methyltransferase [Spirochaetia bacterium]GHU34145.1 SAM-dependent methyltransferase [Spirochaetia bacterium]